MSLSFNPLILDGFDISGGGAVTLVLGSTPIVGGTPNSILVNNDDKVDEVGPLSDGELLIGVSGDLPVAAALTGTANQVTITPGAGSITLSLPQDIATTSDVQFNSIETANIDFSGAMSIGSVDATVINLGNASSVINFNGTVNNNSVINLNVTDQLITLNKGGGAGSASGSGFELEEDAAVTGYVKTSGDRNSFLFKAPNEAGIATITPGAAGITIDRDSHDPATIGTGNGLSITGQELSLAAADAATDGALLATDFVIFSEKASPALDNLSTTSINADLIPAGNLNFNLGDPTNRWGNVYTNTLAYALVGKEIRVPDGHLISESGNVSLNWENRTLRDSDGFLALNWETPGSMVSAADISPNDSNLHDLGQFNASWRAAYVETIRGNTAASGFIRPETSTLSDSSDIVSVSWQDRYLTNTTATVIYDWEANQLNDTTSQLAFDVNSRTLHRTLANPMISWGSAGLVSVHSNQITDVASPTNDTDAANKNYVDSLVALPSGDIARTNFTGTNSVTNGAVTGFVFDLSLRSFKALVSVRVQQASALYDTYELIGVNSGSTWSVSYVSTGNGTGVTFDITSAGQVTYSSPAYTSFTSLTMRFRAEAL